MPRLGEAHTRLTPIKGQVPSPLAFPSGCRFRDRCPYAFDRCAAEHPELQPLNGRHARCFLAEARSQKPKGAEPGAKEQT
jgi:oligopeptide/dipeptide ABC transporter ATP-binding protein